MTQEPLIIAPNDHAHPLNVLGTKVTVLVSGTMTDGQSITLQSGSEGTGPPPHSHAWEEAFFVLDGAIQFTCGDKTVTCLPGTLVHVPPHALHSFRYGPGGGKMLEITGEGSRAIDAFTAVSEKFGSRTVDDSAAIGRVFRANGIEFAD